MNNEIILNSEEYAAFAKQLEHSTQSIKELIELFKRPNTFEVTTREAKAAARARIASDKLQKKETAEKIKNLAKY